MLPGTPSAYQKRLQKLLRKRSKNCSVMSFIHSVSEIRIYRVSGGNKLAEVQLGSFYFKTKSIKSKATFFRTSFLKLQIIRLVHVQWSCSPTTWNNYFYSYTCEKTYLAVHFTKGYFLSLCWQKSYHWHIGEC